MEQGEPHTDFMETLAARLREWTDLDVAMHELALVTGLVDAAKGTFAREFKWIYWTDNKYGNALSGMLLKMAEVGFLEYDEEYQRIRARPAFRMEH